MVEYTAEEVEAWLPCVLGSRRPYSETYVEAHMPKGYVDPRKLSDWMCRKADIEKAFARLAREDATSAEILLRRYACEGTLQEVAFDVCMSAPAVHKRISASIDRMISWL